MTSLVDALEKQQPVEIVRPIITPDAAKEKGRYGNFPLHWAARNNASAEVVQLLFDAHPGAAKEKNSNGAFPLHLAAGNNASVEVVKLLLDAHPGAAKEKSSTILKALMRNLPLLCTHLLVATAHLDDPNDDVRVAARNAVDTLVHPADRSSLLAPFATLFATSAGHCLHALAIGSAALDRRAPIERQSDAKRANAFEDAALQLQGAANAFMSTLKPEQLNRLFRTQAGEQVMKATVQGERKLMAADPAYQRALMTRWGMANVHNKDAEEKLFLSVLIVLGVALLAVATLLVASPLTLLPLLAEVPMAVRVAQLGMHVLMAAAWAPSLPQEAMKMSMVVTFSLLAAWSLLQLAPPTASLASDTLSAFATQPWWGRLLEVLLVLGSPFAVIATSLDNMTQASIFFGVLAFSFGAAIAPASALVLTPTTVLPLLAVAIYPPLEKQTRSNLLLLPISYLTSPRVKFGLHTASRILLIVFLALVPLRGGGDGLNVAPGTDDTSLDMLEGTATTTTTLLAALWVLGAASDELVSFFASPYLWLADRLNVLEALGLVAALAVTLDAALVRLDLSSAALVSAGFSEGLLSPSVFFLSMAQSLRVLQLSSLLGPLVVMVKVMVEEDLMKWLILSLAGVLMPMALGLFVLYRRTTSLDFEGESDCDGLDEVFGSLRQLSWVLFKSLAEGGASHNGANMIDCLEASGHPVEGPLLFVVFLIFALIVLVNLLIALFAKTFDNIFERSPSEYMYGLAATIVTSEQLSLVPPPLSALGVPWRLVEAALSRWTIPRLERDDHRGDGYAKLKDDESNDTDFSPKDEDKEWAQTYEKTEGEGGGWTALAEHVAEAVSDPSQDQMQEHRRWNQMLAKVGSVEKEVKKDVSAVKKDVSAVMEKVEAAEKLLMEKVEAVEKLLREPQSRSA